MPVFKNLGKTFFDCQLCKQSEKNCQHQLAILGTSLGLFSAQSVPCDCIFAICTQILYFIGGLGQNLYATQA